MLMYEGCDFAKLRLPADEAGQRDWKPGHRTLLPGTDGDEPPMADSARRSRLEGLALMFVERQGGGQECKRFALRHPAVTAFERADSVYAYPGALRQGLL